MELTEAAGVGLVEDGSVAMTEGGAEFDAVNIADSEVSDVAFIEGMGVDVTVAAILMEG